MVTVMTTDITEAGVHEAVQNFAQALADTPEFHAFEEAAVAFKNDRPAREAWQQFQAKQRSLQMIQRLGALNFALQRAVRPKKGNDAIAGCCGMALPNEITQSKENDER